MIVLPIPESTWSDVDVALGGVTYTFTYRYNDFSKRWSVDIYLNKVPVSLGNIIMEYGLFHNGKPIVNFDHGVIGCFPAREGVTDLAGRYNIGLEKDYWLAYLTNQEYLDTIA